MLGDSASELIDQFGSETFRAVHESDQDGLIYFDGAGRIEYANRAALELFGLDDDVIGENIFALDDENYENLPVDPIYPSDHFEKARRTYREGVPTRSELVVVSDDERREVEVIWGPVETDGEVRGVVGSYRDLSPRPDIHDQLSVEAARLEEERRFLASILDVLDAGLVVFDGGGTVELVNPAARELLGLETAVEGMELDTFLDVAKVREPEQFAAEFRRISVVEDDRPGTRILRVGEGDVRRLEVEFVSTNVDRANIICTLSERSSEDDRRRTALLAEIGGLDREGWTVEEVGERAVERIVDRLEVDFAVVTRRRADRLEPVAWRGVMLDRTMAVEVGPDTPLAALLEKGEPSHLETWPWQSPDEESDESSLAHYVIPLGSGEPEVGTLHVGWTSGAEQPATRLALDTFERAFARALGNNLGSALRFAARRERNETNEARLRQLVEALPAGVVVYDGRGDVALYNDRLADITHFDDWENLNTDSPPFRLLETDGSSLSRSERPMFRAVREGEACRKSLRLEDAETSRSLLVEAAPLETDEDLYIATVRDVTERRKLSRRKDEFLSIASHELRSPLTPLTGVLQLARRQCERGDEVDMSLLTRAERQVSRLTRLIDGLLDLTRIETDRIELECRRLDLGTFVENRLEPWHLHPKDVELEVVPPESPIQVEVDPDRINQVLTNVVDNAIKYSNANGVIRIDVSDAGSHARVAVDDDGVGMDQETVDRIFDRFYHGTASDGSAQSMGLGLYICRQIIKQHHGDISVESEEGEGTRVEITLPKRQPESALAN